MNGYERITRALAFEKVTPAPRMLHSFMPAARLSGYTMREYREDPKKIARAHIDFARRFNMDGILLDVDTCLEADAIGIEVDYPEDEPARVTKGLDGGLDACLEAMDAEQLKNNKRINITLEAMSLMRQEVGGELFLRGNVDQGPFSLAMLAMGITPFMMSLYDDPEGTTALIDKAYDVHFAYHLLMKDAGADITSFGDSSCGPDLISPDMYRQFSLPWHKRLAKELAEKDIFTICHICGNLDLILEDLLEAKFPAIEFDYKTNVARAQRLAKDKAIMFGPIDPSGIFYYGKEQEIVTETKKILDIFDGKGLVIGAGCALPAETPVENIDAFVRALS